MRITGGALKGRIISVPKGHLDIRPTMDRLRECLFGIIGEDIKGCSFLDMFAGSGVVAIEAASRGATRVVLCEKDKMRARGILSNIGLAKEIGVEIKCHFMAVELYLARYKEAFDYIYLDPPFAYGHHQELLEQAVKIGHTIVMHRPKEVAIGKGLELLRERTFGRSILDFYRGQATL